MQPNHGPPPQFLHIQDSFSAVDFPITHQLFHAGEFHNSLIQPPQPAAAWLQLLDSAPTKEPFRTPRLENEEQRFQVSKFNKNDDLQNKRKHLGEPEAVYSLVRVSSASDATPSMEIRVPYGENTTTINNGSENLDREEANSLRKTRKRRKRRKLKDNLSSTVEFIEKLARQVIDHQEMLHRNYLQVIDRMEKEQIEREEERRCQEAERHRRESISREHERSISLHREAQMVAYLEKITGQSINLPVRNCNKS